MFWNPHLAVGTPVLDLSVSPTEADQTLHNWPLLSGGVGSALTQAPRHCWPMHLHYCWPIQSCTLPYSFLFTWVIFCKALPSKIPFSCESEGRVWDKAQWTTRHFIPQSCVSFCLKGCSTYPREEQLPFQKEWIVSLLVVHVCTCWTKCHTLRCKFYSLSWMPGD